MRLAGLIFADHRERNLPGLQMLQPFAARDQFAMRREDRGNANDIARSDSRIPQGELKARQALAVFSDSLGEENFFRDERHGAGLRCLQFSVRKNYFPQKLASTRSDVNHYSLARSAKLRCRYIFFFATCDFIAPPGVEMAPDDVRFFTLYFLVVELR